MVNATGSSIGRPDEPGPGTRLFTSISILIVEGDIELLLMPVQLPVGA
jgi:hypothetical protein